MGEGDLHRLAVGTQKWSASGEFPAERVDVGPLINRPSLRTGNQSAFLGPERHFQIRNDVSHYTGRHEIKLGGSFSWIDWEPDNVGIAEQWWFSSDAPLRSERSEHPPRPVQPEASAPLRRLPEHRAVPVHHRHLDGERPAHPEHRPPLRLADRSLERESAR